MSIASRITSMEQHIGNAYDKLDELGVDLTNVDKNIDNIAELLDGVYEDYPKIEENDVTEPSINNTKAGKMEIDLKGNTEQNGEPTPDNEIPVEVVSGDNAVKVVNKNLFDTRLEQNARSNADGTTKIWSANYVRTIDKIKVKPNTTYHISFTLESSNGGDIQEYRKDGTYINNIPLTQNGISFITSENCYYINVQWYRSIGITPSDITNIQIEEGSTATTYTEHKEQDFPISLSSKNLCNLSILNQVPSINNGQMVNYPGASSSDFIEINNTKNYILSFSYTGGQANTYVVYYDNNKTFLGYYIGTKSGYALNSYSSYSSAKYVKVRTDSNSTLDFIQLEQGSTATSYQPYYNYELCKIGDYQDYIYKNNDNWYIKKLINKVDLSTLIWTLNSGRFIANNIPNGITAPINTRLQVHSDYYKYASSGAPDNGIFYYTNGNVTQLYVYNSKFTTLNDYNNWTNQTKPVAYYLEIPTDIEITDTTLISQLNALEKAKSYDNTTNIIQENNDLPFILDIKTLKKS